MKEERMVKELVELKYGEYECLRDGSGISYKREGWEIFIAGIGKLRNELTEYGVTISEEEISKILMKYSK